MKYRVAVGTGDGRNITEHFGRCNKFQIIDIDQDTEEETIIEERDILSESKVEGHKEEEIRRKIAILKDCHIILVTQIGGQSEKLLIHNQMIPLQCNGSIRDALDKVKSYYKRQHFVRKER